MRKTGCPRSYRVICFRSRETILERVFLRALLKLSSLQPTKVFKNAFYWDETNAESKDNALVSSRKVSSTFSQFWDIGLGAREKSKEKLLQLGKSSNERNERNMGERKGMIISKYVIAKCGK